MMKAGRKWLLMLFLSPMLLGAQCATDVRDAVVGGALDLVSGTTTSFLQQFLPTWLAGETAE